MKSAILITARLKSTRLPRKALRPIGGRAMIRHMIDRLKCARLPEKIVLITSPLPQDDPLVDLAREEGIEAYRGDPDDVLQRIHDAAWHFDADTIISCTGDNPFTDAEAIDALLDFHCRQDNDFTRIDGLPWGTFSYALARKAVGRALEITGTRDTEVWGGYFTETGCFRCGVLEITDPALRWPELRLTVDTPEDFTLAEKIFARLQRPGRVFPLAEIVALCREHPELVAINAAIPQKPGKAIELKQGTLR